MALKLDAFDLRILATIQANGRITKLALAEAVGLSPTPCWTRLHRLEQAGLIAGYHARLALRRLVSFTSVLIEVTLANHRQADFERFERAVLAHAEVTACWSVGGGIDYLLKVVARDVDAYQRFVDGLLQAEIGIDRYFTYIVTRTVKEEAGLPLDVVLGSG